MGSWDDLIEGDFERQWGANPNQEGAEVPEDDTYVEKGDGPCIACGNYGGDHDPGCPLDPDNREPDTDLDEDQRRNAHKHLERAQRFKGSVNYLAALGADVSHLAGIDLDSDLVRASDASLAAYGSVLRTLSDLEDPRIDQGDVWVEREAVRRETRRRRYRTAGAADFSVVSEGKTPGEAFGNARQEAQYQSGHGGYSGTIAEKGDFRLFTPPKGVKPEQFIKNFHEFQGRMYDQQDEDWDRDPDPYKAAEGRPNVKECRECGSKYQAPPKGTRGPKQGQEYANPAMWVPRGESANFKAEHGEFKTMNGRVYDGPSPFKDELDQARKSRPLGREPSDRERTLDQKHRQHMQDEYDAAGGREQYSPAREGVCHRCGHRPLRQEKGIPPEHVPTYSQMHQTYQDKWGAAVAVPLGQNRYHFMGLASE